MSLADMDRAFKVVLQEMKSLDKGSAIPDHLIRTMFEMFGWTLERALLTIRTSTITRLVDEDKRRIFEVESSNGKYLIYPFTNVCSCPSFKRQVLINAEMRVCKHIIAVRIAEALDDGTVTEAFLESEKMTQMYCDMSTCSVSAPVTGPGVPVPSAGQGKDSETSTEVVTDGANTSTD